MTTLKDRCAAMLDQLAREGSPTDALAGFVTAEIGRAHEPRFQETLPLCLYFKSEKDREEFIEAFREWKPDIITRRVP